MIKTAAADTEHGLTATFAATLSVLLLALVILWHATHGGTAFTTETLRRSAVETAPASVPDFSVVDAEGRLRSLHGLLADGERVWIVGFVYTRCQTLCLALGSEFQRLQAQIRALGVQRQVGLLSISFDAVLDGAPELDAYARRMGAQGDIWQMLSLRSEPDRRQLLDSFGIMVVPAPLGEFEHNAALHIVTPQAQLVRILGMDQTDDALASALAGRRPGP